MQTWYLSEGDPVTLTLGADARLGKTDYFDDQIWELRLKGGEPAAVLLQSSLGLRARWVRLFPRFTGKTATVTDPGTFFRAPQIRRFYPNLLTVAFAPVEGVEATCTYWAPSSRVTAGRVSLVNQVKPSEALRMEWVALLNPLGEGEAMVAVSSGGQTYLRGRCGAMTVVFLISGNAKAGRGSDPALGVSLETGAGARQEVAWAFANHRDEQEALKLAREAINRRWDAEIARIELFNESQLVEFHTHSEAWDAALSLAQKVGFGLFYSGNQHLPNPSFVLSREPDNGFSLRGDGSDYPNSWRGQTALDAYYLADLVLPGGVELIKGVVRNFLSGQEVTGKINWRPGLGNGLSNRLAQPLLAALAWEVFRIEGEADWIAEVYPALRNFIRVWFDRDHDRDGDGYPEWDDALQTGLEDIPLYDRWHAATQGVDITTLECPGLGAMLYQELNCLKKMAGVLSQSDSTGWLDEKMSSLREAVLERREKGSGRMRYRDAQTHQSPVGSLLKTFEGAGNHAWRKHFPSPRRLQLEYLTASEATRPITVRVSGEGPQGEVSERFLPRDWHWSSGRACATSQNVFTEVRLVEVDGAASDDRVRLATIDYTQEDISLFLPLWAGMPSQAQADALVKTSLTGAYALPYGLPICLQEHCPEDVPQLIGASPLWNRFILDGLLRYGYRDLAADLLSRLMDAVVLSLEKAQAFHEYYNARTGAAGGERNHLRGLAPVGLMLRVLGIRKISKTEIILDDFCPYSTPITVKYHGVEIQSHPTHAVVTFPNGQSACVSGPGPHLVRLTPTPLDEAPDSDAHPEAA